MIVLSAVSAVPLQSKINRSVIELPTLRSGDLKHEDVMSIEMRLEALRPGRREVDVGLKTGAELQFER